MKLFSKFLLFLIFITLACEDHVEDPAADSGEAYFPLRVGMYHLYKVDEIQFDQGNDPETLAYELQVEVIDSFRNTTGSSTYVIHRSKRTDASSSWQFIDTWSARKDGNEIVVTVGNTSFVKLDFPLYEGKSWNGNKLNNEEEDDYTILTYDEPSVVQEVAFDKTLTIEQELNDDPIVYTDIRSEVYARDVGLIKKETTQLLFCQEQTCGGNELIETGLIYKQEIIDYGVR